MVVAIIMAIELVQPARAGSAGHLFLRLYIKRPEDFHTGPTKKDIQQSAAKCSEIDGVLDFVLLVCLSFCRNGGAKSVGNRLGAS